MNKLSDVNKIHLLTTKQTELRAGIITFKMEGIYHSDRLVTDLMSQNITLLPIDDLFDTLNTISTVQKSWISH